MKLLSRSEEIILLAVWRLRDNAYGVTIREQVSKVTGHEWPFGAIYVPLDKLTRKRYVRKTIGDPTPERGGRRKCLYEVTSEGRRALKSIRQVQDNLWDGISQFAFD
ncbi:PadR family transcriptional regulator [candidate division KSB1 bacterium]